MKVFLKRKNLFYDRFQLEKGNLILNASTFKVERNVSTVLIH